MKDTILIIEDSKLLAKSLALNLNNMGLKTLIGYSWQEGRDILNADADKIGLIFLDYLLPDSNGLEILDRLKENENFSGIPVVILTSIEDQSILNEGLSKGAKDYLIKSNINVETLIEFANKYIDAPDIVKLPQ
ncbi:TPA: hypothetical protein DDW69_03960 [candidate division CPR2 bacterium]|uniref:Winged-helix phosphate transcriptional response regulator n=1 Tax=candidate division CPR2 bacterium GW2011_GWC1_41_48 TaxID=1618344 RepID=A0A0G0W7G9_UNCC2|nr:MAG: Winged-helix phosphate transcriptional response regulator [candidate division CPR2 bacterium GW2011_GWC2_39_35]KKR28890.1 MAG: Winged-helix phosphate transcriptional response regulator [candidate division CPR2 bacterium GW2011_GWD2_39_7]KKR29537.1 MAG: Winged-helix phosphate transcriptional response regulator [candidate division CPR2 bacterium GW2011_GWD1_39_7]KKS08959.1 MAG: Winged-helix phosphate transcriptional response regulator [candidate division CPR2 bacterium GW2011_GWC1_41_48]O